jgi:hypothetical protein
VLLLSLTGVLVPEYFVYFTNKLARPAVYFQRPKLAAVLVQILRIQLFGSIQRYQVMQ